MSSIVLVKMGGSVAGDTQQLLGILRDIKSLWDAGVKVVVMHGGGPQATALTRALGHDTRIVGGRRITDSRTLDVMKMVLGGEVATDILGGCRAVGLRAAHVSGVSDNVIVAKRRPPRVMSGCGDEPIDFGHVGDIDSIGTELIHALLKAGVVPIVNSLGADAYGAVLNINADIAANRMAVALGAERLFLLTGAPGVLENAEDESTRIPSLSFEESRAAIEEGTIHGGMIPKLEESFNALKAGLKRIHILAATTPGGIQEEWESPGSVGTVLHMEER